MQQEFTFEREICQCASVLLKAPTLSVSEMDLRYVNVGNVCADFRSI